MRRSTTKLTSTALLVASTGFTTAGALAASEPGGSESRLLVNGQALYDDNQPIRGANVLLLRGEPPRPGDLPAFAPIARAITDANGAFRFRIAERGAYIVELLGDECQWFSVREPIDYQQSIAENAVELRLVSRYDACPCEREQAPEEFGLELYNRGDSIFFGPESAGGYGGTAFRIVGGPEQMGGVHIGGDVNYVYQGMMQAARGNALRQVHDSVISWNVSQFSPGRIPNRIMWATYGFDYYRTRP